MAFLLYNQDKWWYKAITWFLVLALIVMISIGVAPRARAVGVLTFTVMAAILAVMAGAGIYTVVSGMAASDMQSWLQGKLNQWDAYRNDGNIFTDLIEENLITTTVKGFLSIGSAAARSISDFISWLKADIQMVDNNTYSDVYSESGRFGPIDAQYFPFFEVHMYLFGSPYYTEYYTEFHNVYVARTSSRFYIYSLNEFSGILIEYRGGQQTSLTTLNATYHNNSYYEVETINAAGDILETNYYNTVPLIDNPNLGTVDPNQVYSGSSIGLRTGVINIPTVSEDKDIHIDVGAYPGIGLHDIIDQIINAILENILTANMALVGEFTDAIEAVIINELPIEVNTDHHAFGFVPPEISFDFSSIWHYVEEAIEYSLSWISWFMGMLTAIPVLAIPLFCCFTLVVVLGAFRRFLL